jgi:uncharacterized protein (TIGR02145 family)
MKKLYFFIVVLLLNSSSLFAQVSVNTDGTPANGSAMLDVSSDIRGILIPRMTLSQRNSISSPATGLLIYQTDNTPGFYYNSGTNISPVWIMIGAVNGWSLSGNSLTGNEVFGSTNSQPVKIFSNSLERIRITATGKVGIGMTAPQWILDVAGSMNLAQDSSYRIQGYPVVSTKGTGNTFIGIDAGKVNTGSQNAANGFNALYSNTSGGQNTANGYMSMYSNMSGWYNVANGTSALYSSINGYGNTADGYTALMSNKGNYNTAVGFSALHGNIFGSFNTAVGYDADVANSSLTNSTAIGNGAVDSSDNEIRLGNQAVRKLYCKGVSATTTTSPANVYVNPATGQIMRTTNATGGNWSLNGNVGTNPDTNFLGTTDSISMVFKVNNQRSGWIDVDKKNCGFGYQSLLSNTVGISNSAFGYQALYSNQDGAENSAFGFKALYSNQSGVGNSAFGKMALSSNSLGSYNTANGLQALQSNNGDRNTASGFAALAGNTSGSQNTAYVTGALHSNLEGEANVAIGNESLHDNTDGSYNTALGYQAGYSSAGLTNSTSIGNGANASADNEIRLGNNDVNSLVCKGVSETTTENPANVYVNPVTGQIMRTTNTGGTGNVISGCIDIDGNAYPTFMIGAQQWTAENLRVTHYRNGDTIPNETDDATWAGLTTGAYCWYNNDQSANAKYGTLYNWYAVHDSRNICPEGWHVPSDDEWTALTTYLGGESVAGGKMKSVSALWNSPNTDATNNSGFSGFPGGFRYYSGGFSYVGGYGGWWSATEYGGDYAWFRYLGYDGSDVYRSYSGKASGYSVRCVRD